MKRERILNQLHKDIRIFVNHERKNSEKRRVEYIEKLERVNKDILG